MPLPSPIRRWRLAAIAVAAALALAACADGEPTATETTETTAGELVAQVASFDVSVGQDQRLLVGLFTPERGLITGGEVSLRVGYLGDGQPGAQTEIPMSEPVPARFLPVPGKEPEASDTPRVLEGTDTGAGVYEAAVDLDQPGNWGVQVAADVDGATLTATAVFPVAEEPQVVAVGDPVPRSEQPTVDDPDADPAVIDSRAGVIESGEVPDPELHDTTVAALLDQGRPFVVVVSTPIYCVSQFCGPITDTISELAASHGDRAGFVHLEVWQDFEAQELNPFVADWIVTDSGGNEPWVFLVGADGTIQARWDNVLDEAELEAMLEDLPA